VCIKFNSKKKNFMGEGTESIREEVVTRHADNADYRVALLTMLYQTKLVAERQAASVSQIVQEQEGIIALISVVYWLAKEQTATPSLAQLFEQRGVKVSAVHRTPQAAATFTRCLTRLRSGKEHNHSRAQQAKRTRSFRYAQSMFFPEAQLTSDPSGTQRRGCNLWARVPGGTLRQQCFQPTSRCMARSRGSSSHLVAGNARQVHRNDMTYDFV
jgi:hypothetical protein